MRPFRDLSYDARAYAEVICSMAERKRKCDYMPEESYESIVRHIACWLEEWLTPSMPKPSYIIDMLSDAFLLVMRSKRKALDLENCMEFILLIRNDVFSYLGKDYVKSKGIRTTYNVKK